MRMGEGKDTKIDPETRLNTFSAAREAGLLLGTCLEPIGPEHSIEEIAEKILVGREAQPCYSGAARRLIIRRSDFCHIRYQIFKVKNAHPTTNPKVAGSNPAGRTSNPLISLTF